MKSQRIEMGLDCDGVLIHYREQLFFEFLQQEGFKADYELFAATHNWLRATSATHEQLNAAFTRFIVAREEELMPVPGARRALERLSSRCTFHLVTSRAANLRSITIRSLNSHIGRDFSSLTFGRLACKGPVVCEKKMSIFVDDSNTELEHIVQHSPQTICVQFPSFRQSIQPIIEHDRVIRLEACNEVESGIDDMRMRRELWERAWQEIVSFAQKYAPAKAAVA